MLSPYDKIRADARAQIARLNRVLENVDWLESMGGTGGSDVPASATQEPTVRAPREAVNGGQTWAEAVDGVLSETSTALTVAQIVEALRARGRKFPPKARADTPIRVVLKRRGEAMQWTKINGNRWIKAPTMGES